jgi:hypothetical protein
MAYRREQSELGDSALHMDPDLLTAPDTAVASFSTRGLGTSSAPARRQLEASALLRTFPEEEMNVIPDMHRNTMSCHESDATADQPGYVDRRGSGQVRA